MEKEGVGRVAMENGLHSPRSAVDGKQKNIPEMLICCNPAMPSSERRRMNCAFGDNTTSLLL
eukprot:scaffold1939_cov92-Cylindrotheca_fusiformis.AAC.5